MIWAPYPFSPYPPILFPDPEVLQKYGIIAAHLLRMAKKQARRKGREHKQYLEQLASW